MRLTLTALNGWLDLDLRFGEPDPVDEAEPSGAVLLSDTERAEPFGFTPDGGDDE